MIDYSEDTNHLFDTLEKRAVIQTAANVLAGSLGNDHLAAITASGANTWSVTFPNPSTGASQTLENPNVPADTIVIFVGGHPLQTDGEAGRGSTGGYSASGDQVWLDTVEGRG